MKKEYTIFSNNFSKRIIKDNNNVSGTERIRIIYAPRHHARSRCKEIAEEIERKFPEAFQINWKISPFESFFYHIRERFSLKITPAFWYCPDIKSAFASVTLEKFYSIFTEEEKQYFIKLDQFEEMCFTPNSEGRCIIEGAPSSNVLFQLYMSKIDIEIQKILPPTILYTRYCDDLLFSSCLEISKKATKRIMLVIHKFGLTQSDKKTRSYNLKKHVFDCFGYTLRIERATGTKPQKFYVSLRQDYLIHLKGYFFSLNHRNELISKKDIAKKLGMFNGLMHKKSDYGLLKTRLELKIQKSIKDARGKTNKKYQLALTAKIKSTPDVFVDTSEKKTGNKIMVPYYNRDQDARNILKINQKIENREEYFK